MKLGVLARNSKLLNISRSASNFKRSSIVPLNKSEEFRSKYVPNKNVQNLDWKIIRNNLMEEHKHITKVNIDATILGFLQSPEYLPTVKSYLAFLSKEEISVNWATLGRLLRLYWFAECSGHTLSQTDKNEIKDICQKTRNDYEILDSNTCENLILGIVVTDSWQDSLELLNMMKLSGTPTVLSYSAIISKAFETNAHHDVGWNLLEEMVSLNKQPKCRVFMKYFDAIANSSLFPHDLEKMLIFLREHEMLISRDVINHLREVLTKRGKRNFVTRISEFGMCDICQLKIKNVEISDEEFNQLRDVFLNKVLISNDVYLKSNPQELKEFLKYLEHELPFDCVIDGLNIAYSSGIKKPSHVHSKLLLDVVKYFVERKKRVLVLGRKHMLKWPQKDIAYMKKHARMFLTNNLSQDDPFLLFATMNSGKDTNFFSRDLMRSHSHLMGPSLKPIFKRWQQIHQYSLVKVLESGEVIIKEPTRYFMHTQKNESTWHIPFRENYSADTPNVFELPDNWLCVKC